MLYRVHFQLNYGGFYYSESFEDIRDARNLRDDILDKTDGVVRYIGTEVSTDEETWEPERLGQTPEDAANAGCSLPY